MPDLPSFDTDEAISATLDGEFDHFAAELGLDALDLRAHLTARPDYGDRLAAMESARSAVRVPVDEIDDVTRARLLRGAAATVTADPPVDAAVDFAAARRRNGGRMLRVLSAAAAVVLVLGIGTVLLANRDPDGNQRSAKSAADHAAAGNVRSGDLGDLGPLSSAKLDSLIGGPAVRDRQRSAAGNEASSPDSADASLEPKKGLARGGAEPNPTSGPTARRGAAEARVPPATTEQIAACQTEYAEVGEVRFSGTGEYEGRTAIVLGVETGGQNVVFVVAANDCANVLYSVSR